jgi:putative endonuclease
VKTRASVSRGTPEESVSAAKRKRLVRLAGIYLGAAGVEPCPVRFDVISIRVLGPDRAVLRHHRAPFVVE